MDTPKFDWEKLPKEHIFQVPEGYFEDLPMRIQNQTSAKPQGNPLISWSARRSWAVLAACLAIGTLVYFTFMPSQESLGEESLAGVNNDVIELYLMHQEIHQNDVVEHLEPLTTDVSEAENNADLINNLKISQQDLMRSVDVEYVQDDI